MSARTYAMDTSFYHSLGVYEFDARCEMLCELGYDATYLTLWREGPSHEAALRDVPRLAEVRARHGLDVAAVYVTVDIAGAGDDPGNRLIADLVRTLEGCTTVEISMRSGDPTLAVSDPAGDARARRFLEELLRLAEPRGITLALYPHIRFWLERIEDAVRLCRAIDHPLLCTIFCGYHWYALGGPLPEQLAGAAPYLHAANLCGSRRVQGSWHGLPATIEPLDDGELDNFAVLGMLQHVGFGGRIGVQGFAAGGDVYHKLRRSLAALRDMERRLAAHPGWARLRSV